MSRIDVLRSLLLQATKGATDGLRKLPPVGRLEQKLRALAPFQAELDDAALTAAVARVASVLAASVRADGAALCVDASFDDGTRLSVRLFPLGFVCAPFGPKELSLRVEPAELVSDLRTLEVCGALASAIVHAIYRGLLPAASSADAGALVSRQDDTLVVDLRSVPALRRALGDRGRALALENIKPSALDVTVGTLRVRSSLEALEALRRR
jgi:hypothetical protein